MSKQTGTCWRCGRTRLVERLVAANGRHHKTEWQCEMEATCKAIAKENRQEANAIEPGCGSILDTGHKFFNPNCSACVELYSDAPEWTI